MAEIIESRDLERWPLSGASCALGVFDGVHKGHQSLIGATCADASSSGGNSVVITFDRDPDELFRPSSLKKLMTNRTRIETLAALPVDRVLVLPFTCDFAAQSPSAFLESIFSESAPYSLHIGIDFRFGSKARGTVDDLMSWAQTAGTHICPHVLEQEDGSPITATRIRELLSHGHIHEANQLLGRHYFIEGEVSHGRGEGGNMGFKTANLTLDPLLQVLGDGVYAAYAVIDGITHKAAASVGVSPMFADKTKANSEIHVIDYCGDLYGKVIRVEFIEHLRPMMNFPNTEDLIATVTKDISWVRHNLPEGGAYEHS